MAENENVQEHRWCFSWDPTTSPEAGLTRAALMLKNQWAKGSIINVGFLDGDPAIHQKIRDVVSAWTEPGAARLTLVFVNDPAQADIRISFKYAGSWSVLGTSCQSLPKTQASMNFGWLTPNTSAVELRRVVLHEFGHALSLIHEHQNPTTQIPWNRAQVYKDLSGPPNNWDKATIDHNIFEAYKVTDLNATPVDTKSIMMYPIPATWVTDPKFAVGLNNDLSPTDKALVHKVYP
jgi:serralysin